MTDEKLNDETSKDKPTDKKKSQVGALETSGSKKNAFDRTRDKSQIKHDARYKGSYYVQKSLICNGTVYKAGDYIKERNISASALKIHVDRGTIRRVT